MLFRLLFRRRRKPEIDPRLAGLADLLYAAGEDPALHRWLQRLPDLSDGERAVEVARFARNMERGGEPPETVRAARLLADHEIATAARNAIR